MLNATWVESGERAIASDLRIEWSRFHDARDQLYLLNSDLPLGTAAHNAARFPYINPIGSLHATAERCASRSEPSNAGSASSSSGAAQARAPERCGHLADGGYFDNSGASTTLDVLRGFDACLGDATDPDTQAYPRCRAMPADAREWLRAHVVPQVLVIRNDVDPALACAEHCPFTPDPLSPADVARMSPESWGLFPRRVRSLPTDGIPEVGGEPWNAEPGQRAPPTMPTRMHSMPRLSGSKFFARAPPGLERQALVPEALVRPVTDARAIRSPSNERAGRKSCASRRSS